MKVGDISTKSWEISALLLAHGNLFHLFMFHSLPRVIVWHLVTYKATSYRKTDEQSKAVKWF